MHLFLSPHADDAALSCGGQIAQLTRSGQSVVIFTIMAGDPPLGFTPTDFTRELHKRWGLGDNPTVARRKEDTSAGNMLGAEVKFGPYADAIYRVNPKDNTPLYPDEKAIFGTIHPDDPVQEARRAAVIRAIIGLFDLQSNDVIHVPLAIGGHVDHQLVRDMGQAIAQWRPNSPLYFYDDYPYSAKGHTVIQQAVGLLDLDLKRNLHPVDSPAIDAKIAAVGRYKSQISSFWDSENKMAREIRAFVNQVGGEGEWRWLNN
ncbi:MAG: PIG-L family deacetylase [Chloroflexota bacterium]